MVNEDKERNFVGRQFWTDNGPISVINMTQEGLSPEAFEWLIRNYHEIVPKVIKMITITPLEDLGEEPKCRLFRQYLKLPLIVSNRCIIPAYYYLPGENGEFTYISSSRGNDELIEEKYKD